MKTRNSCLVILVICSILLGLINLVQFNEITNFSDNKYIQKDFDYNNNEFISQETPKVSTGTNYQNLESTFNEKLNQISSLGYFSQVYESSLEATFYALYVLNATGTLEKIDQAEIISYIMAHYNDTSHIFMDSYAKRYLGTDFSKVSYYPFPTLLEVNCFAILSLDILGGLGLIDVPEAKNFIWNCYNPDMGGFIGQPYSLSLHDNFKISTLDNTYYAVLALDFLGEDWTGYANELLDIVYFIKSLQITDLNPFFGGFMNDENDEFASLDNLDITLLSSYYGLKCLDILERIMIYTEFHQFLDKHYDSKVPYFEMSFVMVPTNYSDIVGTALGLQLSDLSGYSSIDRNGIINFIINNRNSWGIWDASRYYAYHELTDSFQIIRALKEAGELSQLSANDKDQIATSIINYYQQYNNGFSILSKDYTSLRLLQTVVKSAFNLYLKTEFSDYIQEIYNYVISSYHYISGDHLFAGCLGMFQQSPLYGSNFKSTNFHSRPLEFHSDIYDEYYGEIGLPYSHKTTYNALEVLYYIGMLDEFENECDLNGLFNNIIETQFLNPSYSNYGGFTPNPVLNSYWDDTGKNNHVFLEYTYHAVKSLELLADFLNLGQLNDLNFNKAALYSYVIGLINETSTTICCDVPYTKQPENMLMNTYYAIEILKALNLFDLQKQKIKNFVLQTINYTNIKSIYFSFKISKLLDLNIEFDIDLTSSLVETLYSNEFKEYYQSTDFQILNQQAFLWVCDIAFNNPFKIECDYKKLVYLGGVNTITISISNMIFTNFDQNFEIQYKSSLFGISTLEKQFDGTYQLSFLVPEDPDYFPEVTGTLKIYHHSKLLGELPIIFQTDYDFSYTDKIIEGDDKFYFEYNVSYGFASGKSPADNTRIYATVFKNGSNYKIENFTRVDYTDYSKFTFNYSNSEEYTFNITLIDDFYSDGLLLNKSINESLPQVNDGHNGSDSGDNGSENPDQSLPESQVDLVLTVVIGILVAIVFTIVGMRVYSKKTRIRKRDVNLNEKFGAAGPQKILINNIQDSEDFRSFFTKDGEEAELNDIPNPYIGDNLQKNPYNTIPTNNKSLYKKKLMRVLELMKSFINFAKENKKIILFISLGIMLLIGTYYYTSILMTVFMLGGFVIAIVGGFGYFLYHIKLCGKIAIFGILLAVTGFLIYVMKLYMNLLL